MRIILIFTLLVIIGICGEENHDESNLDLYFVARKKEPAPALVLAYNKLAIITRVTNAIVLQAEGIRKLVKVRDVVAELIRSPNASFYDLMDVDPTNIFPVLNEIIEASKEMSQNVDSKEMQELNSKTEMVELMIHSIKHVKTRKINEKVITDFFDRFKNGSLDEIFIPCDTTLLDLVINFTTIANKADYPNSFKPTDVITQLNSSSENITECLKHLELYNQSVSSLTTDFEMFLRLGEGSDLFEKFRSIREEAVSFLSTMDLIEKVFLKTKKFWSIKRTNEVGRQIKTIFGIIHDILNPKSELKLSLTLGFPNIGDIAKVSEDLKSSWFKSKVAHGKSVGELEAGLDDFFKFGKMIKETERSWVAVRQNFTNSKKTLLQFTTDLEKIGNYKGGDKDAEELKNLKRVFQQQDWTETFGKNFIKNADKLLEVKGKLEIMNNVMKSLHVVRRNAEEIPKSIDTAALQSLFTQLKAMPSQSDDSESIKAIEKLNNLKSLLELGDKFRMLHTSQKNLNERVTQLKNISDFQKSVHTAKDILVKSSLAKNIIGIMHSDFNKLLEVHKFSKRFYEFTNYFKNNKPKVFLECVSRLRKTAIDGENFVKDIQKTYKKSHKTLESDSSPVLKLEDPQKVVLTLGRGMFVLKEMTEALTYRLRLMAVLNYTRVHEKVVKYNKDLNVQQFFENPTTPIKTLIMDLQGLNKYAVQVKNDDLLVLKNILDEATKVNGFREVFKPAYKQLLKTPKLFPKEIRNIEKLSKLDLHFAAQKGHLHAASLSFNDLETYFDTIFGLDHKHEEAEVQTDYLPAIGLCIGIFIILFIVVFVVYGRTPSGRQNFINWYLYYFGKEADFQKRWRYSFFTDRQDGNNALVDAAQDINATNVLKAVKKGAYIDVYSKYGNTPLHVASKSGYPEIVEILIKNGADRTLLNAQNKTAEQLIPPNYKTTDPESIERYEKIKLIFKKYQKKKFRRRLPDVFPVSSYKIYIDEQAIDQMSNSFMERFIAITTDETSLSITHFIVKTDENGTLVTDAFQLLSWVLSGVLIMKNSWMKDCLGNESLIKKDYNYFVENIKFKGAVYNTVLQWSESFAKGEMLFLHGVYAVVVSIDCSNIGAITAIVTNNGGVMCEKFPEKKNFNIGSHPYLHAHLGPLFVIHDGKVDLKTYKNDPDKMYTLFTEDEFIHFMLKRKMNRNKSPNPIPAVNDLED
ncbi:WSN domain-containing protein [Caenorhabditis elegans]|uniref:WSN domain-containing protein n=1 Tax=Caenorhabditis elegans TaxID=6239 RepID=Q18102_CAEEL|nr:WSN domain-containing protein [Caenorhabditis elegans]CCD62772.2 WSN domain-containing protein [Caenorhabditis elegans]